MKKLIAKIGTKVLYIFGVCLATILFQLVMTWFPGARNFYLFSFYPAFSGVWRILTRWCPFSIGDLLYVLAGAWFLTGIARFIRNLLHWRRDRLEWLVTLLRFTLIMVCIYGIFMLFWGINYRYNRLYKNFGIRPQEFSVGSLVRLCDTLAARTNGDHRILAGNDTLPAQHFLTFREIKTKVPINYSRLSQTMPELRYAYPNLKPSMFGYLMNYAGVTGYFNPFTGEGQVNTTPMPVSLPFTACHEVAHQLGFAAEDDANFIGYLVAATSPDAHFRYAANFEMFLYSVNALSYRDPHMADSLWNTLITPGVRKDYEADFAFYERFRTSVRPVLNDFYDQYLKANEQTKGIRSYSEVISLLINYVKKYGKIPG
jgi:hypothetical protein